MSSKISEDLRIKGTETTIVEFWRWAYSDLLSNTNRGILAEFLVGHALGLTTEPRMVWDKADFVYNGNSIEVKSSAYIQSWEQKQPSKIVFSISKAKAWDYSTGEMSSEAQRNSNCYVFCVFTDKDKSNHDILDVNRWDFYVLTTSFLNQNFLEQKSISLSTIQKFCSPVTYSNLKKEVDSLLS
ncbi:hypothetical protein SAMN04487936_106250 [Halobacillus dabanensis]|uniref:Uncharacterized protein n=1 Tax=Halobacillus dabanensis TaxID=240302 RepID=A0A1I3W8E8_HALDA|nr:hypothetical protein [Halobacillus dabanensis]SFK03722.1 hypothetical protein SAMN04487936_106250 [Halobacillus dabanensis]